MINQIVNVVGMRNLKIGDVIKGICVECDGEIILHQQPLRRKLDCGVGCIHIPTGSNVYLTDITYSFDNFYTVVHVKMKEGE